MKNFGIIFDLDGTLWDSSENFATAFNKAISGLDDVKCVLTADDIKKVMGRTLEDVGRIFFGGVSEERLLEIVRLCCAEQQRYLGEVGGVLYPSLEEVLSRLSGEYKLFIVSNCQEGYIQAFYKYHKLERYFTDYEEAGRTHLTKGENIRLIIERNRLCGAVYIGDTQGDFDAAQQAGIPFIHARYGFGRINTETMYINNLTEISEEVKQIENSKW